MLNKIKKLSEKALPLKILRQASSLFAKETGMSGPQITDYFAQYGNHIKDYWELDPKPSRWIIFEDCLKSFSYEKQIKILKDLCEINEPLCRHGLPSEKQIEEFKKDIYKLSIDLVNPLVTREIDFEYIKDQIRKSEEKIQISDYEGAITNARSLIESVLLYILNELNVDDDSLRGDLPKMYKVVAVKLSLSPGQYQNNNLKQILTGCFSIINGMAAFRNEASDAHGKEKNKYKKPDLHHARFYTNIARSFSDFVLESLRKQHAK